jgi:hypothetical protein
LGFRKIAELHGILATDNCALFECIEKDSVSGVHAAKVTSTDRAHLNDFPVNEFHSFTWCEDARIGHPIVVIHGKAFPGGFRPHSFVPLPRIILRSLFPAPSADVTALQFTIQLQVVITPLEMAGRVRKSPD